MSAEIDVLKTNLNDKLEELRRRASHAREIIVTPTKLLAAPWLRLGLAAAFGYYVGSLRRGSSNGRDSVLHAIVRAAASATATFAVSRALKQLGTGDGE